ncbi:MAG TPA: hypothetical protein VL200_14900 [Lacunisphaera sp.]|jgi:hypothetical protein|nr:hypothetical protein [Lacunisphaera sp.]
MQNAKNISVTVPVFIALFLVQDGSGVAQTFWAVVGALTATGFARLAAHFVWTPFLRKAGFWWSAVCLGCAIVAVGLAATVAGARLGVPRGVWTLLMTAAIGGVLFSWLLAAMHGAQDQEVPDHFPDPTLSKGQR